MTDFKALAKEMRELGVARLRFDGEAVAEIELAPYVFEPPRVQEDEPDEVKRPNQCEWVGCDRANGWAYLPTHCREHGLIAMGVQGVDRG